MISTLTFSLGKLVATQGALQALQESGQGPSDFLSRHSSGDWGEVTEHDKLANGRAIDEGDRILSAYMTAKGVRIWVITEGANEEGKRNSTCILLPSEY